MVLIIGIIMMIIKELFIMDLNEKFEINRKFKNLRDYLERLVIFGEEKDEDIIELHLKAEDIWNKVSYPLNQVENEYAFFNSLHRQTKYDNIISLIKICERLNNVERLDIDKSKIVINIVNPNFDNAWDQINDMIEIPQDIIDFIDEYDRLFEEKEAEKEAEKEKEYVIRIKNPDGSIGFEEYFMDREIPYKVYLSDEELDILFNEVFRNE